MVAVSFQAIADLWTGHVCGYEVLSRPCVGFANIGELLETAHRLGETWRVEAMCRQKLFRVLGDGPRLPQECRLFVNVSPNVFLDSRFSPELLRQEGLGGVVDEEQLVIELTEGEPVECMQRFRTQRERFRREGIRVALDDFGGGYNGLSAFRGIQPDWLKLDMDLVRGIDCDVPGQEVIRVLRQLVGTLDIELVAEGIETAEELRTVAGLGVRYVQGYLIQRPQPLPTELPADVCDMVRRLTAWVQGQATADEQAMAAVRPARTIKPGTVRGVELDEMFRQDPELDHVVLARDDRPLGLITRNHYYRCASGHFGFPLIQKRWVDAAADEQALVLAGRTDLATAARMAMARHKDRIYDPVIVVDGSGRLLGTMTIRALLDRSTELRVNSAMSANPLTRLPGNTVIDRWLDECLNLETFTIVYADLDQFKAYNDTYGFAMGDQMIELVAGLLVEQARDMSGRVRVGHIGGDDFVLVSDSPVEEDGLARICAEFDRRRLGLFREEHVQDEGYCVLDRQGQRRCCSLVTLSLAVVTHQAFVGPRPHRARLAAVAASLKKRLKEESSRHGRSAFMYERRRYNS
jgi:EAL domain-containing protein (putative c-di-GMP-specific phosphodiesterase class I)/GGDEF domain-containing protein